MKTLLAAALAIAPVALAQTDTAEKTDTASRVTLPLAEYERLRAPERPKSITVVDTLRLSGTFKDHSLTVTFIGKSVGNRIATPVLGTASGLSVWGCTGNAIISRGDNAFQLTPLADSFNATC